MPGIFPADSGFYIKRFPPLKEDPAHHDLVDAVFGESVLWIL